MTMGWGDELMVTGQARIAQERDKRKVRVIADGRPVWHEAWLNNPRFARRAERGDFQILASRVNQLRPYAVSRTRERWGWKAYGPAVGELYFTTAEKQFGAKHAGHVILEPHNKAKASPNKSWGWMRWNKLAIFLAREGVRVTQLGPANTPLLEGADFIETKTMREAAAVMANARAAVMPEGGLHHVAAAVGTPAVVIFGGYISPAVTGYDSQTNLYTGDGLGCGMRVPCEHCRSAMARITPDEVMERLLERIGNEERRRTVAA